MKNLLLLFLVVLSFSLDAQIVRPHITKDERANDMLQGTPRQRVSRLTSLTLTDQWQTVQFVEGSSAFNVNTFPQARWDYTNHKLLINPSNIMEQAYDLSFDYQVTNVTGQSKIQLRFVIPSPAPVYFPFPDDGNNAYVDLSEVNMIGIYKRHFQFPIYGNANMRQYGVQIQMRVQSFNQTSNILTGVLSLVSTVLTGTNRVALNNCSLNIYAK